MRRGTALCLAGLLAASAAHAQTRAPASPGNLLPVPPGSTAPSTVAPGVAAGAAGGAVPAAEGVQPAQGQAASGVRFLEGCQQAADRGQPPPSGCQGPLYGNEIARLREEALRTQDPNLLTLLGDAYQNNRSGVSDVGQAYRWYVLAAVRGDPRAMQRLSELYKGGQGAPQDRIRALGYARLAERIAPPGSAMANDAASSARALDGSMASDEVARAERFATELEASLRQPGAGGARSDSPAPAASTRPGVPGVSVGEGDRMPRPGPPIPGLGGLR